MAPGILYVTMQPKASAPNAPFHDWYNNEHGPLRLRLSFCKNGFRYRAADLEGPGKGKDEWMAVYDLDDVSKLNGDEYMKLRGPPCQTQRERDLRPHLDFNRKAFDFISERSVKDFNVIEKNVGSEKHGNVTVQVAFTLQQGRTGDEVDKWYEEEHIELLSKVQGWRRTRRFKTASIDQKAGEPVEYMALHDYAPENGLGSSKEFIAATTTDWAKHFRDNVANTFNRRVWQLYYTFGAAPRDLSAPADWDAPAIGTKTLSSSDLAPSGAIESYITTKDGAKIAYRLEGSKDADAPLIVCSNCILAIYGIWDNMTKALLSKSQNQKYRVLRYNTRGRTPDVGKDPITVDRLGDDIIELLDALRVEKAALAVGVSLGGATVLNVGLRHPGRIERSLSCDTNSKSPAGNSKAWSERIEMAEKDKATAAGSNEPVVGDSLAEITTRRWFVKETYDGGALEKEALRVKDMVHYNSLEGFRASVKALWEYDMDPLMAGCKSKGAFLVGAGDGVLPAGMKKMAEALAGGTTCTVIEGAGHLPMVEKPEQVAAAVEDVLKR